MQNSKVKKLKNDVIFYHHKGICSHLRFPIEIVKNEMKT